MALSAQKELTPSVEADLLAQAATFEAALANAVAARDAVEVTLGIRRDGAYNPNSAGGSAANQTLIERQREIANLVRELTAIENRLGYTSVTQPVVPTQAG